MTFQSSLMLPYHAVLHSFKTHTTHVTIIFLLKTVLWLKETQLIQHAVPNLLLLFDAHELSINQRQYNVGEHK